ncbi:UDP-4-amino-4,6-dideoxy-N-acetyl-beta-L-altrosamine transaminase [Thalassospiraceae bacterium LMO-JJ14]|nr:UDP-4-amino-4,6-dideoxy-N-acetyl-beta-L-altrosamine transaminase [Thalassospiraceae bacterium LMO-JJ14]
MGERPFLPYGRQSIDEDDIAAVRQVLEGDFLTTGPAVEAFERALAQAVKAPEAIVCANGTAALHLATMALDLGPGDAAVVPAVTFLATANVIRFTGAEVVFADVDPNTGLMGAKELEQAIARTDKDLRLRVALPVHLNGQCADPVDISSVASVHGLDIIEDACHSLGTEYADGMSVGACHHARMSCFSFHPVKTVAMGEGGAITTRDPALGERLRLLRNHGMERDPDKLLQTDEAFDDEGKRHPWYYEMQAPGYNYRACDLQCALGTSQLSKLPRFAARRRALMDLYDRLLAPHANMVRPVTRVADCRPVLHLYPVLIEFDRLGLSRDDLMRQLAEAGIGTQVHYLPVHRQPYYRRRYGEIPLPGADAYHARVLSLPFYSDLEDSDVERVVDILIGALKS